MKPESTPARIKGFTLIEMLVTVTIIIILMGIVVGGFEFVKQKQARSQAAIQISLLSKAIEEYKLDKGVYPPTGNNKLYTALYWDTDGDGVGATKPDGSTLDEDQKLYVPELDPKNNKQGWTEGMDENVKIIDPWAGEYIYKNASDPSSDAKNPDFDIISLGKDGAENTSDDIRN